MIGKRVVVGDYAVVFHAVGNYVGHPEATKQSRESIPCWVFYKTADNRELARLYEPTKRTPHRVFTAGGGDVNRKPEIDPIRCAVLVANARAQGIGAPLEEANAIEKGANR